MADENNHHENERLFFHGSPFVQTIIQRGFDERHAYMGGMFGAGLYFILKEYVHLEYHCMSRGQMYFLKTFVWECCFDGFLLSGYKVVVFFSFYVLI